MLLETKASPVSLSVWGSILGRFWVWTIFGVRGNRERILGGQSG